MNAVSVEPGTRTRPVATSRLMIAAAWSLAAVVLAVLALSVERHLSSPSVGMSMALYRQGDGPRGPLLGSALFTAWHVDAVALGFLVLLAALYLTGIARVRRRGGSWPLRRAAWFAAGLLVIGYATCGAIAVYDMALFSAHMVGHLLLIMVAPALLVAGQPLRLAAAGSGPRTARRLDAVYHSRAVALLTAPPVALATYAMVIVGTHLTGFMDRVMSSPGLGQFEHLLYLVAGFQFFLLVVGDEPIRWRLAIPLRWLFLALAMAVDTITGVVLLQQQAPIGMMGAPGLDIDPLTDTHTGGAIMWVGGDGIMVVIMIGLIVVWTQLPERDRRGSLSWLEQARLAHFAEHSILPPVDHDAEGGGAGADLSAADIDEDDRQLDAYNAWLQKMSQGR